MSARKEDPMHTHFSAVSALQTFLAVLIVGSLWRLTAAHMVAASNSTVQFAGRAMLFQY